MPVRGTDGAPEVEGAWGRGGGGETPFSKQPCDSCQVLQICLLHLLPSHPSSPRCLLTPFHLLVLPQIVQHTPTLRPLHLCSPPGTSCLIRGLRLPIENCNGVSSPSPAPAGFSPYPAFPSRALLSSRPSMLRFEGSRDFFCFFFFNLPTIDPNRVNYTQVVKAYEIS